MNYVVYHAVKTRGLHLKIIIITLTESTNSHIIVLMVLRLAQAIVICANSGQSATFFNKVNVGAQGMPCASVLIC